jgi:hypothetical protein
MNDALNRFTAGSGAGFDAAGRRVYSGPGMMYSGPGERAATMQVHSDLERMAFNEDPYANMIRQLLDDLRRNAGTGNYFNPYLSESQRPVASSAARTFNIDNRDISAAVPQ